MKMILEVVRRLSTKFGTPGRAVLADASGTPTGFEMDTLELGWHGNQKGISCIKAGIYRATRFYSPHFTRELWKLEDRDGRADCEFHNGNFAGDESAGLFTQIHGCTLVGNGYGDVDHLNDGKQYGIVNSRSTLDRFMAATGEADELMVEYKWAADCAPNDDN